MGMGKGEGVIDREGDGETQGGEGKIDRKLGEERVTDWDEEGDEVTDGEGERGERQGGGKGRDRQLLSVLPK